MKMNQGFKAIFIALLMVLSVVSFALAEDNATDVSGLNETADIENETASAGNVSDVQENETLADENGNVTLTQEPVEIDAGYNETEVSVENETEIEVPKNETPSITPDNPFLWGLKRAIEKIDYLITIGKSAKAQKGLVHARERLLEVQAMIAEKKFDAAEKAAEAHKQAIEQVAEDAEDIGNGDVEKEIAEEEQVEAQIKAQDLKLREIRERIRAKLSGQDLASAEAILASSEDSTLKAMIKVVEKKNKAEIKLRAETKARVEAETEEQKNESEKKAQERAVNKTEQQEQAQNKTQAKSSEDKEKGKD